MERPGASAPPVVLSTLPSDVLPLAKALADRYALEREIGRGGMAVVYLARDLRHDRRVALKVLNADLGAVLGVERFVAEIRVTANLQHPNLLPLFDSGGAEGKLFYVMPYVEGESLRAKLQRDKQLPIEEALHIAASVASALDYAHKHGVVHRDLKPENILLQGGQPMIADFGIALAVSNAGGARVTQTGISLGTPQYMSPEQATGDRTIDGRSDIYSLAAVTYEMLTGEPPHTGSTSQSVIAKLLTDDVRPMTMLRRSVPAHVDEAVRRGLEKLPADRFATANEFAQALGHAAGVVHTSTVSSRARVRSRRLPVVATGAFAAGVALAAVALWSRPSPPGIERHLNIALPDSLPVAVTGEAPLGIWQRSIAISRDGRTIAYVARTGGVNRLAVRAIDGQSIRVLPGTEGAYSPFFSPDGKWIAFFSEHQLKKVPVSDGLPVVIASAIVSPVGGAWPTPDQIVVASDEGGWLDWWPAAGGARIRTDSMGANNNLMPHVLPGGKAALAHDPFGLRVITFSPLKSWAITPRGLVPIDSLLDQQILGHSPIYSPTGHIVYSSFGDGALMAIPFDPKSFAVKGAPIPVLDRVRKEATFDVGQYAMSEDGTFVYLSGGNGDYGLLALADPRTGRLDTLQHPRSPHRNLFFTPDGSGLITRVSNETNVRKFIAHDVRGDRRGELPAGMQQPLTIYRVFDDSTALVVRVPGGIVSVASLRTGEMKMLDTTRFRGHAWIDMSPRRDFVVLGGDFASTRGLLMLRRLQGDTTTLLFPDKGDQVRISPDGRWLAYTRLEDFRIAVSPIPPTGVTYQISNRTSEIPAWSEAGDRIYYRSDRRIWATEVSTRNGFRVGATSLVVEAPMVRVRGRPYAVRRDGRIAVVLGESEESLRQINVVTGFHERLKRLAPR